MSPQIEPPQVTIARGDAHRTGLTVSFIRYGSLSPFSLTMTASMATDSANHMGAVVNGPVFSS
jgi:hypothetical protein